GCAAFIGCAADFQVFGLTPELADARGTGWAPRDPRARYLPAGRLIEYLAVNYEVGWAGSWTGFYCRSGGTGTEDLCFLWADH
ncbi:hypothetical protein, partial [Ilumatobacter sp.]|uniref:hypothetical protein n=1 Tax=Ilumatobacter sp. TaxID=1967498 RepID=UPI00375236EE